MKIIGEQQINAPEGKKKKWKYIETLDPNYKSPYAEKIVTIMNQ